MAESESDQNSKLDFKTVKLTGEDIPGAKLPRDSIDKCSVVQLKRWLPCRGAKTTGIKKSLVARVQDYIKHGFDVKYLRDPDGGVNLLRKKAELGVLDNEEPEITEGFPKQGFVSDLKRIPRITFGTVWKFMIERVECKKQLPISQMNFVKHDYSKPSKVPKLNHSTTSAVPESVGDEQNAKILNMMKEYQSMSGNLVSWTHILPLEVPQEEPQEVKKPLVSPIKVHPVSAVELTEKMKKAKKNLTVDQSEVQKIESQTRGQSNTELWHQHRQPRITATKCYRVAVQRDSTSPTKTIRDVLGYDKVCQSKAMQEGLRKEDEIIKDYKVLKQNQGGESMTVTKCGFFISQSHGFLGASPDGIVHDPSAPHTEGLIEIKYIQTLLEETLENALVRKGICKKNNDIVTLNERHKYYFQVQQQMFVTEQKWTDFVVKGSNSSSLFCQRVHFCKDHWESILPQLEAFFDNWIVPELVYPRVKYGMCKLDTRSL